MRDINEIVEELKDIRRVFNKKIRLFTWVIFLLSIASIKFGYIAILLQLFMVASQVRTVGKILKINRKLKQAEDKSGKYN